MAAIGTSLTGVMSDLSPQCAPERTSAGAAKRPYRNGSVRFEPYFDALAIFCFKWPVS